MTGAKARPLRCVTVGEGETLVLLHGYGLRPETYLPLARLLADRARIAIPDIFALPERWTYDHALDCLDLTIDELGLERVSLLAHSFGGALQLGLAARAPQRVVEFVFSDTLGVTRELLLAREAVSPAGIVRMATPEALAAFAKSFATHPVQLARAALFAFFSDRDAEFETCAAAGIPGHVLWAAHDSILSRADGQRFADRLNASFTIARRRAGQHYLDHDWMFEDPENFAEHLDELDLRVLAPR